VSEGTIDETLNRFAARDNEFKQADRVAVRATMERSDAPVELVKRVTTFRKLSKVRPSPCQSC
jgi:hypothetical protein